MSRTSLLALLATPLLCAFASSQTWSQINTANQPSNIRDAAMAFQTTTGESVLFGGWPSLNQTWTYDGTDWTLESPATTPPGRREFAMCYDIQRDVVVMFGGRGSSLLSDTWEWDGTNWTNVTPASSPPARQGHVMAYDITRGVTVLFGGTAFAFGPSLTDTWEWNGVSWTQVPTANNPIESVDACMCYDLNRGVCVLAGGTSGFGAPDQSTWEYDGNNWTNVTGTVGPMPSLPAGAGLGIKLAGMVYDLNRGVSVLYGGQDQAGAPFSFRSDTWEYDGNAWTLATTGTPTARIRMAMCFDSLRNVAVMHGGSPGSLVPFNETWEYSAGVSAAYDFLGAGCPSSAGVATNTASALPVLGGTCTIDIGNLPAPEIIALVVGATSLAPGLDVTFLDITGCFAFASPDSLTVITGAGGTASLSFPLPATPGLAGAQLFTQALVFEAGVNPFGAVLSDAATLTAGS